MKGVFFSRNSANQITFVLLYILSIQQVASKNKGCLKQRKTFLGKEVEGNWLKRDKMGNLISANTLLLNLTKKWLLFYDKGSCCQTHRRKTHSPQRSNSQAVNPYTVSRIEAQLYKVLISGVKMGNLYWTSLDLPKGAFIATNFQFDFISICLDMYFKWRLE